MSTPSHCTRRPRERTPAANFGADFSTVVAGRNVTPRWDAVVALPPLQPHCLATTYNIFPESASNDVANTYADADSAALVDAPVSLTLLSQMDPLHPLNDEDDNPNGSPGGKIPCAIRAALHDHGTVMDAIIALKPHTPR